eukprot:533555-Prorocentrum_minimum.AAC.3
MRNDEGGCTSPGGGQGGVGAPAEGGGGGATGGRQVAQHGGCAVRGRVEGAPPPPVRRAGAVHAHLQEGGVAQLVLALRRARLGPPPLLEGVRRGFIGQV